ncbi:MAG: hypothetical protein U9R08_02180 [Nanoarchaeota archaeon]|nr:hypothetical protein [Nanoarchaeota archaeon]
MNQKALFSIVSIALIFIFLILQWYVFALAILAIALWYGFVKRNWFDKGGYCF